MNYIFQIDKSRLPALLDYYKDYESTVENPNALVTFRSPEVTVTIFKTLKVMIQGTDAYDEYLMWADLFELEPEAEKPATKPAAPSPEERPVYYFSSSVGSDEVGTGDFFGPVVVCAAFVEKSLIPQVEALKVKDSKKMSDETILSVGETLKKLVPHVVLVVDNPKYNDLVRQGYNMNKIKAYLHNHAIKKILQKINKPYDYVIVDQFCAPELYFDYLKGMETFRKITFLTQGESAHLAVASASVIARYVFLQEMDALNAKVGFRLPLGASSIVDLIGKRIALEKGLDFLPTIAKTNFKNLEKIRDLMPKH
jgi:ribonuclease HIII